MGFIIWLTLFGIATFSAFNFGVVGIALSIVIFLMIVQSDPSDLNFFKKQEYEDEEELN